MLYFFLSYARGDDDDSVQKFFYDLSAEVRAHAGLAADVEVGFFDVHSLEVGATWSPRLVEALSQCRSFLALVSPRYLVSDPCGREWAIFADRLRRYERDVGVMPSALLPLLWLPPPHLPRAVAALQYDNDSLPEAYGRTGLRQLIRLQRHRDNYYELIVELARQIVRTAHAHDLPAADAVDFADVRSVFDPAAARTEEPADPSTQYVHFVVAAPARDELATDALAAVGRDAQYYGATSQEWAPYRPMLPVPIADHARAVAERRRFSSGVADTTALAERIGDARRANQIVVLLVDAWATMLREYRQALAECNQLDRDVDDPVTAVMVPLNHDDQQAQAHRWQLVDSLRAIFYRRAVHGDDVMFRSSILTHQAFDADLQVVLEAARNRLFSKGTVHNRPPGQSMRRPILEGP
ncbi:TIR-like protein FxsC [Actinomycetes bacterium KLBMP 9797]